MTKKEIDDMLNLHGLWLRNQPNGVRANLRGSNLRDSDLSGSDLSGSNLSGSDLRDSDLRGSNLSGSNLRDIKNIKTFVKSVEFKRTRIFPDEGDIIGWKKCRGNIIVQLLIPAGTKRSHAFGRKCRAEWVKVLEVFSKEKAFSIHDQKVEYKSGEIVKCDKWNEDFTVECGGGIHFYITRAEAEAHE